MDKHYNKIIKIDGAPGVTLEGRKGATGKNGGMLFFTDYSNNDHSAAFGKFDIWPFGHESEGPYFTNKYNFCKYANPSVNDYILTHIQNTSYVYIINAVLYKNDLREGKFQPLIEAGLITQEYANKISHYYKASQQYNDCCFVTEISSLSFFTNIAGKSFDINITKTMTESLSYQGYTGIVQESSMQMGVKMENAEFAMFSIIPAETASIKDIKIEAEFYTDSASPEMGSILPNMWSNPKDSTVTSNNYPFGYLENYSYKINYDSENLDNFTVILKDWNSETGLDTKIPTHLFNGYTVYIYAYAAENSNENSLNKYFITSITGDEISSL